MIGTHSNHTFHARGHRGGVRRWLILLMAPLLALVFSSAPANAAVTCHNVNAKGTGGFAPPEPGDPADLLRTFVRIQGGGLLQGVTRSELHNTFLPPTTIMLAGDITFTANRATLTVTISGTFDVVTGEFVVAGPVTASSGKLAGAVGDLTLRGVQQDVEDPTGAFTETVTGEICVDLGPGE